MQKNNIEKPTCKYCDKPAYKTNGRAEWICYNRAYTGRCEGAKPFVRSTPKTGRNELCPCGSEKKYKRCCGKFN